MVDERVDRRDAVDLSSSVFGGAVLVPERVGRRDGVDMTDFCGEVALAAERVDGREEVDCSSSSTEGEAPFRAAIRLDRRDDVETSSFATLFEALERDPIDASSSLVSSLAFDRVSFRGGRGGRLVLAGFLSMLDSASTAADSVEGDSGSSADFKLATGIVTVPTAVTT